MPRLSLLVTSAALSSWDSSSLNVQKLINHNFKIYPSPKWKLKNSNRFMDQMPHRLSKEPKCLSLVQGASDVNLLSVSRWQVSSTLKWSTWTRLMSATWTANFYSAESTWASQNLLAYSRLSLHRTQLCKLPATREKFNKKISGMSFLVTLSSW